MSEVITVGCDPEFFIQKAEKKIEKEEAIASLYGKKFPNPSKYRNDAATDVFPVCGLVGGSKVKPMPLKGLGEGFFVQEDGIACEFNIPPQTEPGKFSLAVSAALRAIEGDLHNKGFGRSYINSVELQHDWTTKHPDLLQIGCDPDYCAYDKTPAPRTLDMGKIGVTRGAGGHLHLGYPVKMCPPNVVARFLDCVIAIPTLEDDPQGARRKFWGVAGLYRPKPYGLEYRTLSNFWIWSGGMSTNISAHAIALIQGLQQNMIQWQAFYNATNWDAVYNCIYAEDVSQAKRLFEQFKQFKCFDEVLQQAGMLMYARAKPAAAFVGEMVNG